MIDIADGLRRLGLDGDSAVVVHTSMRSFGPVEGGAVAVCEALAEVCGTVLMPSGTWSSTGVPAPPGLIRPNNAVHNAESWERFDEALARAVPFSSDLPVDGGFGIVPEIMRRSFPHARSSHPLFGFLAVGAHADRLIEAARDDRPLGPLDVLAELGGKVLLLGVDHTSNTTIHLAEQRLGRSRFFRYAKTGPGTWGEFPNVSGESHRFDAIEPELRAVTTETRIGACRARLVAVADVLATTERLVTADPRALLCDDASCRCGAAYEQRLLAVRQESSTDPADSRDGRTT